MGGEGGEGGRWVVRAVRAVQRSWEWAGACMAGRWTEGGGQCERWAVGGGGGGGGESGGG